MSPELLRYRMLSSVEKEPLGPAEITLRLGTDAEATFPLEFGGFDPNRLILDGLEYQRVR